MSADLGVASGVLPDKSLCKELVTEKKDSKDVLRCQGASPNLRRLTFGDNNARESGLPLMWDLLACIVS